MTQLKITLDPASSVYELIERTNPDTSLLINRQAMLILSREIEEAILLNHLRARVFVGFQRMSHFLPQAERYRKMSHYAESIYVFGIMDAKPPSISSLHYVPIKEGDRLAKEWFLIADAPGFHNALAAEETEANLDKNQMPMFSDVWTLDGSQVGAVQTWLTHLVDALPLADHADKRNEREHLGVVTSTLMRLIQRLMYAVGTVHTLSPQAADTTILISAVIENQIGPSVKALADRLKQSGQ